MVNFNDTDVTETMVLNIQITGVEKLEKNGIMIYGLDKNEITVTVKGSNRDLKKYEKNEYKVTVDVSGINETGQHTLPLTVSTPTGSSLTVSESEPLNVSFKTDYIWEKTVPLDVFITNTQDIGLVKYSYESIFTPEGGNAITIKGPKSAVELINSARFNVDGSFVYTSDSMTFTDFPLIFLDKNYNQVNVENTEMEYSTADIDVTVKAIAHKSIQVNVICDTDNMDGMVAKVYPTSIEIWGTPSEILKMTTYDIRVNNPELGKTVTHTVTEETLPEGISVKENVVITISFEESVS